MMVSWPGTPNLNAPAVILHRTNIHPTHAFALPLQHKHATRIDTAPSNLALDLEPFVVRLGSPQAVAMADSQPQQTNGGQQGQQLLRPDDILKLTCLPEDEKQKYRLIMQNFWGIFNQHQPGTSENTNARQKLTEWSSKFIARERQYRGKMKAQQQQQGNQGQSSQPSPAGQQNQSLVKQEAQALNRGVEGVAGPVSHNSQGAQPPPNQGQNPGRGQVDPAIVKHVHEFPMQGPLNGPAFGTPEYETKLKEYRTGYLNMLAKQSSLSDHRRKIVAQLAERQSNGQEVPQDLIMLKNKIEKEHVAMKGQIDKFRSLQKQWKDEREQNGQSQAQAQTQGQIPTLSPQQQPPQQTPQQTQQPQQLPRQPSQPNTNAQPQIKEEPQIKIEGGQAPQLQPQAQPQQQFNPQANHQQAPPQQQQIHQQQLPPSLPPQQQQQQQQVRPSAPHSQTMPPNQQQLPQFAQQNQQQQQHFHQQQQQQRPQINPMQANAHPQSNSPHPQSATSAAPGMNGPPVPLSHQAAVSAANRSYTDPTRTNTPLQAQHPGQQNNGGGNTFGSREREQLNNPKMPIPRHLNVTSPSGVHMGTSRPTMSGPTNGAPGQMGMPVIPRPPPFQLEGEGDRVLSKRKLDELVRQVVGGGPAGEEGEVLTSEVEEVCVLPLFPSRVFL
jgi:hypothetical protein